MTGSITTLYGIESEAKLESSDVLTLIVCATTVNNNKVLLVRHASVEKPDYGDWLLPAGRVEPGGGKRGR